jgi:hypothetical protein
MIFPTVCGENLTGRQFVVPYTLEGEYNLVMVAFEPAQQFLLRTWLPVLSQIAEQQSSFRFYELPTLGNLTEDQRIFIDHGMRRSISDPDIREIVITLYVDKIAFCKALDIRTENTIHLFLIDHEGEVLWRCEGIATQYKKEDLLRGIQRIYEMHKATVHLDELFD